MIFLPLSIYSRGFIFCFSFMAKKPIKKTDKKTPKIPGLPKDANVKVIEITPMKLLFPIAIIALLWSVYSFWATSTGEKITYHDDK